MTETGLMGTIDGVPLKDLTQKMRRGLCRSFEAGRLGGHNAYARCAVRRRGADGTAMTMNA